MSGNAERIDAIQKRVDAATPGPWEVVSSQMHPPIVHAESSGLDIALMDDRPSNDAEFIAAAPSDVAFLLDLAREQQAALEAVQELVDHAFASPVYVLPGGYPSKPVEAFDLRKALEAKP